MKCKVEEEESCPKLFKQARETRFIASLFKAKKENPMTLKSAIAELGVHNIPIQTVMRFYFEFFKGAPWKIPKTLPDEDKINNLLCQSMRAQMGYHLKTEFDKCVMSGDSLTVSGHLYCLLKCLGIRSEVNTGILKVGDSGLPMTWLTVHGTLIDNTNHYWPGSHAGVINRKLLDLKGVERYIEEDPTAASLPLLDELGSKTCVTDPKLMKAFGTSECIEKLVLFRAHFVQPYINCQFYFFGMYDVVKDLYGGMMKNESAINKWCFQCWSCERRGVSLMACSGCKVARYCDTNCQKADWLMHKLLHKDLKANTAFQKSRVNKDDTGGVSDDSCLLMIPK